MRTITFEKTVYNFEELDENIQKKLIYNWLEEEENFFCENELKENMGNIAREILKKYFKGADFINVYYDLSYSQGSGAMIEFDTEYYGKTVKVRQYGHYYHERSFTIEGDLTENQEQKMEEKIVSMNNEISKAGYKMLEYYGTQQSIDEAKDCLKGYEYFENGETYSIL